MINGGDAFLFCNAMLITGTVKNSQVTLFTQWNVFTYSVLHRDHAGENVFTTRLKSQGIGNVLLNSVWD